MRVTALAVATVLASWTMAQLFDVASSTLSGAYADRAVLAGSAAGGARVDIVSPVPERRVGRQILTQDEWHERIRSKDFWAPRRAGTWSPYTPGGTGAGPGFSFWSDPGERGRNVPLLDGGDTYRTVCVRLCDGFYWPISFSTSRDRFDRDRETCESSCGSPTRLYIYRNPGGEPDDMTTVDNEPYSRLPTAFKYRTTYDAQCRCGPQPWEREALDRHRIYALEAAIRKGDRTAAQQIADLKARREAERRRLAESQVAARTAVRNGMLAAPQPRTFAVLGSAVHAEAEAGQRLQGTGRAFGALPVVVVRGPVIVNAGAGPALRPGEPVVIMRLGVGETEQGVTRKSEPSPRRTGAGRRERPPR